MGYISERHEGVQRPRAEHLHSLYRPMAPVTEYFLDHAVT